MVYKGEPIRLNDTQLETIRQSIVQGVMGTEVQSKTNYSPEECPQVSFMGTPADGCDWYSGGGKLFDPLLILYVCSLTKKLSVYNFNGRFIWTVRNRIITTNPEKRIKIVFLIDLHFNESNKYLTPLQNMT